MRRAPARRAPRAEGAANLAEDAMSEALATGRRGAMAEYLRRAAPLEARGIPDRHLWRMQEGVAERPERGASPRGAPAAPRHRHRAGNDATPGRPTRSGAASPPPPSRRPGGSGVTPAPPPVEAGHVAGAPRWNGPEDPA